MYFEIISEITDIEIIARGRRIHELSRLRKKYGPGIDRHPIKKLLPQRKQFCF
jgi:hypothetical protein